MVKKVRGNYVSFGELEKVLDELGINKKRHEFCNIGHDQYRHWKKKGKVPASVFWSIQNEKTTYFAKEFIKNMVKLKVIDIEFINELRDIIENE